MRGAGSNPRPYRDRLTRWPALTRNVGDGNLPAGSNWIENRIRPIARGRANWLFAGSLR
ncbi:MAG: transposase, partial [Betaproteobacteria bacterium]